MSALDAAQVALTRFLKPTLAELGFEEIKLKHCMRPEFLFRRDRIWFSLSWDWRDQYLEVCLGRLFWFRDVMPRVVVIGDFSYWDPTITWDSIGPRSDIDSVFGRIRDTLPDAVARIDAEYPKVMDHFRNSRDKAIPIDAYFGEEVQLDALEKFKA